MYAIAPPRSPNGHFVPARSAYPFAVASLASSILAGVWQALFLAAPFILFGLLLAGVLQVFLPQRTIVRWMGGGGLAAAARAALIGIPLPICSCGIVPVSIALRRRGASPPATLSFLISTPESDVDAVVLTWGMFGPLMAVARLLASFLTSMVAAVVAIACPPEEAVAVAGEGSHEGHAHAVLEDDEGHVSWSELRASLRVWLRRVFIDPRPKESGSPAQRESGARPFSGILHAIFQHAFVEFVDDIVFWLAVGIVAAGAIGALVPPDLFAGRLGSGLLPMLVLLVVGVAMYMCASASTPIAAALAVKGVSPGAALVFLLTGPATNTSTILLLARHFGRRFLRIYLGSIVAVSLVCGLALDALVGLLGLPVAARVASETTGVAAFFQLLCALALLVLMAWRLWAGAGRQGIQELRDNFAGLGRLLSGWTAGGGRLRATASWRRLLAVGAAVAILAWLGSGFAIVALDSRGYAVVFGRVVRRDLPPGLHWAPPAPFGRLDIWHVHYPRKVDIGFRTDLERLADRRALTQGADPNNWHSPVAAMNTDPQVSAYLAGDENLFEMSFSVHFTLSRPFAFFYRVDRAGDLVALYAQAAARELVATQALEHLLTADRQRVEDFVARDLQRRMDALGTGVRILSVHVVDLHPPQEAVFAFRDVASAREDRETRIHAARQQQVRDLPRARGRAVQTLTAARAGADAARVLAVGRAAGFSARVAAFARDRPLLRDLLWREAAERVLANRQKFIVPPGGAPRGVTLWQDRPPLPTLGRSGGGQEEE
ncbi:MAG TPA: SO_0444 family Cu/Zn efflux transporter [Thermoanaerobaculia bacterium]|nr:SO_0444 family Cu/Zn efflux transporter [Thermoanaerobaculia bacterium]